MFPSKAALCRKIGMKRQFLGQIERGIRPLPVRYALAMERTTGGEVMRHELRPDIYPYPEDGSSIICAEEENEA